MDAEPARDPASGPLARKQATKIIKPALHHVTFKTSRLQEMIDWYHAVLGMDVQFRDAHAAWTTNDAANHRIAFLSVPGLGG